MLNYFNFVKFSLYNDTHYEKTLLNKTEVDRMGRAEADQPEPSSVEGSFCGSMLHREVRE